MRRLDPTADPALAVADGYYVPPPNAVSQRIATRLELEPQSSHLLVGGIGSGKTTELIAIERHLAAVDDMFVVRVDVATRHRLEKLKVGVLLAIAAVEAGAAVSKNDIEASEPLRGALEHVTAAAKGYWRHPDELDYDGEDYENGVWVNGILETNEIAAAVNALQKSLSVIVGALPQNPVFLFDGVDRVVDLAVLAAVLAEDVPAIARAGAGVVVVGPQLLRFSPQRSVEGVFETVHLHGPTGVDSEAGERFLTAVLRARAEESVLPPESASALVRWSGGVLRDLVALGRAACAEAYAAGADLILSGHVDAAADRFGRDLLLGCTAEMVARLKDVGRRIPPARGTNPVRTVGAVPPGATPRTAAALYDNTAPPNVVAPPASIAPRNELVNFTVATEVDQRLISDRLFIEVPGTPVHYIVHPTVVPLIAGLRS